MKTRLPAILTSKEHVNEIAGWKLVFHLGEKTIEFVNKTDFEKWNKKAEDAPN